MIKCPSCSAEIPITAPEVFDAWESEGRRLVKERDSARAEVARLQRIEWAAQAFRCCDQMTVDVPKDSIESRIPYCPKHGRHQVSREVWALLQSIAPEKKP